MNDKDGLGEGGENWRVFSVMQGGRGWKYSQKIVRLQLDAADQRLALAAGGWR